MSEREPEPEPNPYQENEQEQDQEQEIEQDPEQALMQQHEHEQEREGGNEGSMLEIAENFLSSSIINHFSREDRGPAPAHTTGTSIPANEPERQRAHQPSTLPDIQDDRQPLRNSQEERSANAAIWQDRIDEESSCTGTEQTGRNESSSVHTSTLTQSNLQSDYQPREPRSNTSASSEVTPHGLGLAFDSRHSAQGPPRGRIPTGVYMPNSKGHYSTDMRADITGDPEFTLNAPDPGLTKSYNYLISNN
jgi:hypothetical protein